MQNSRIQVERLSSEEQIKLIKRYQQEGDKNAGDLVVEVNMPWVYQYVSKFGVEGVEQDDLIQAGAEALCRARDLFDEKNGTKFLTYAAHWVKAYVLRTYNRSFIIRRERGRVGRKISTQISKAKDKLLKARKEVTVENLAKEMKVSPKAVQQFLAVNNSLVRLNKPAYKDRDGDVEMQDLIPSKDLDPSEEKDRKKLINFLRKFSYKHGGTAKDMWFLDGNTLSDEFAERLIDQWNNTKKVINFLDWYAETLDDRSRDIWYSRILSVDYDTLGDIAERWEVSKERIRQVENDIKNKCFELASQQGLTIRL